MNLQEQISRIQSMMGVMNEQVTGDTSIMINKLKDHPVTLIGDQPIKTEIHKVELLDDGTIDIHFKNGQDINISQDNFRSINLKVPLKFNLK
jgi:hypothetical protein